MPTIYVTLNGRTSSFINSKGKMGGGILRITIDAAAANWYIKWSSTLQLMDPGLRWEQRHWRTIYQKSSLHRLRTKVEE
jgi:hypothetical protein